MEIDLDQADVVRIINKWKVNVLTSHENATKIGRQGDIIEVDETHIYSRKNNRARILAGEKFWLVGAISRETKEVRLFVTKRRNKTILHTFILININICTRIVTDCLRGYNGLEEYGYQHNRSNHKLNFVDQNDPEFHTQTIERLWRSFKESNPSTNTEGNLKKMVQLFEKETNLRLKFANKKFNMFINAN